MKLAVVGGSATLIATACTLLVPTDGLTGATGFVADAGDASPVLDASSDVATAPDGGLPCPVRETDLLAYYRFDEGHGTIAADCSGNGRDGLVTNPTWAAGKRGGALVFDGTATCVAVGSSTTLTSAGPFTAAAFVSVAVYADDVSGKAHYLISKANEVPDKNAWRFASDATTRFSFKVGGAANAVEVMTPDGQPTQRWVHVAAVFDPGKRMEVWLDGVLLGSLPAPAAVTDDPTAAVRVGCLKGTSNFFSGAVDELKLYGRALSQDEIIKLAR